MSDDLLLDRQLCFALYAASRAMTAAYRPVLDDLGLTYPQYLVLLVLWQRDGQTVKELGEALCLDSGTLSPLLKRMEAAGLVARRRRADDERVVEIRLTPDGTALRERARGVPYRMAASAGLSPARFAQLRDDLTAVTEKLRSAATPPSEGHR